MIVEFPQSENDQMYRARMSHELRLFLRQHFGNCYIIGSDGMYWCRWKNCNNCALSASAMQHADDCPLGWFLRPQ